MNWQIAICVGILAPVLLGARNGKDSKPGPVMLGYPNGTTALSPNGQLRLRVSGSRPPKLFIESVAGRDRRAVWPIERGAWVLWRPDSRAFALSDARYSNHSFLLVFLLDKSGGSESVELSPPIESTFQRHLDERMDIVRFLIQAVRWLPDGQLLAVVYAETVIEHKSGARGWDLGYVVDVRAGKVVHEMGRKELKAEYDVDPTKVMY